MNIIINGKNVEYKGNMISYRILLELINLKSDSRPTITHDYCGGGTLIFNKVTYCKKNTIFNIFETDKV